MVQHSVKAWMDGTQPVAEHESHFLDADNLVSSSRDHTRKELLDHILEKRFYQPFITKVRDRNPYDSEALTYCEIANWPGKSPSSVEY